MHSNERIVFSLKNSTPFYFAAESEIYHKIVGLYIRYQVYFNSVSATEELLVLNSASKSMLNDKISVMLFFIYIFFKYSCSAQLRLSYHPKSSTSSSIPRPISFLLMTFLIVIYKILISNTKLKLFTYQTSYSNFLL